MDTLIKDGIICFQIISTLYGDERRGNFLEIFPDGLFHPIIIKQPRYDYTLDELLSHPNNYKVFAVMKEGKEVRTPL